METFYNIVAMAGGLALFLYGMRIMGDGLKSSSGGAMKAGLAKVTGNPFIGFLFGVLVTCMIQSSTATIVLTVGLVGAGFLSFRKSVGIVLGANVGTAITAQIIRLMDLQAGSGSILNLFKSDNLAPMALLIGMILIMFVGTRTATSTGTIFMGFGILFVGLMNMSAAVKGMGSGLTNLLVSFENNPFLGFLSGVVVTGVIQSSSAVVGILQTLASSVGLKFCGVFAVIIGVNIGDCITTFLVCRIGAKPEQIRTCLIHIIYNVCAATLLFVSLFILRTTGVLNDDLWNMSLNAGGVANIHGLFRLVPALVLLPFSGKFADLAERMVADQELDPEDEAIEKSLRELDGHLNAVPGLALEESHQLIMHMAETAMHNLDACTQQMWEYDPKRTDRINQREDMLDRMADACNKYLVEISPKIMLQRDAKDQSYQMKAFVAFERIGDLAQNITEEIDKMRESKAEFSKQAMADLKIAFEAVREVMETTMNACKNNDAALALQVEPLEEVVDELLDILNQRHVNRVTKNKCTIENGILYQNIMTNLERVSDQCSDFAVALLGRTDESIDGNEHQYLAKLHRSDDPTFKKYFEAGRVKYIGALDSKKVEADDKSQKSEKKDLKDKKKKDKKKNK